MRGMTAASAIALILGAGSTSGAQDAPADETHYQSVLNEALAAWPEPEGRNAPPERIEQDALHVLGNIANTMFHEFGHGFVSMYELPIVGNEEDAVDAFANVVMVSEGGDPYLDAMIEAVADDWFLSGQFNAEQGGEPSPWDVHSPDEKRAAAVVCILVGADPEAFGEVADEAGMPPDRQEACTFDYQQAQQGWDKLLAPHYLKEGEAPKHRVTVTYVEPPAELAPIAEFIKASGLIDDIAAQMEATFRLPNPVAVSVESCGEENAFWSPDENKVTFCYEIAQGYWERTVSLEQ